MTVTLSLLDDVRWRGESIVGERPRALLAALVSGGGRSPSSERLIELVWGVAPVSRRPYTAVTQGRSVRVPLASASREEPCP